MIRNRPRTKCISVKAYPGAPTDPALIRGQFYDVLNPSILTIHSPDPYIEIRLPSGESIQRPRHLFGRILSPNL